MLIFPEIKIHNSLACSIQKITKTTEILFRQFWIQIVFWIRIEEFLTEEFFNTTEIWEEKKKKKQILFEGFQQKVSLDSLYLWTELASLHSSSNELLIELS